VLRKVKITAGRARGFAWLNSTKSAEAVWQSLPLKGMAHSWGKEIYFRVPINMGDENSVQVVDFGDVAYWPEGGCLCVFFGPTPASLGDEIRAASPVNILGRVLNDPRVFSDTSEAEVMVERVEGGVDSVAIGADEHTPVVDAVTGYLNERGLHHKLFEIGPWPEVAEQVGRSVASGEFDEGILLCWTGTGVSIVANKIPGVRAALCHDAAVASGAR